ncbi:MAG: N-glycosylase/DNA lyase [Nanoarchaeota archaeon]|nr:N-glycosylase/DNA lyase [Nanoarchaeota archaeon]
MKLVKEIEKLKKSEISKTIDKRINEFKKVKDLFSELSFCLMTAGFRADKCIEIQKEIGTEFETLTLNKLKTELKRMGHRFWPQRAERIFLAQKSKKELSRVKKEGNRDWLIKNIKGLGMKESSHFLRNVGFEDVAIIDFHIVDLLKKEGLIEDFKNLNKKKYLEIEETLRKLAKKVNLSLGKLDLYLWYIETGKVLK